MTDPEHSTPRDEQPVDLTKQPDEAPAEAPFDPYRFGAPDVPPPPEYAPPGYVPPAAPPPSAPTYSGMPYPPYGTPPPGAATPPYPQPPHYPQPAGDPYRAPGYPPPGGGSNGRAVTSLVLGILSIVFCFTSLLDAVLVVLAIIFGALGLSESKWKHVGRGQAVAGLTCAAVGAVLAIAFTVWAVHVTRACDGYSSGSSAYEQCIRNHL